MSIERLGAIWPEWQVVEQLGEGSFGKVYKVVREDHGVTSTAAVKVISIPQNDAELTSMRAERLDETGMRSYFGGIVADFVNEIQMMESMKGNSYIVSVEDYKVLEKTDKIGWDIFIRMELLTPLNDYIADRELTEAEVVKLGQDICAALELCDQRKIIHRDIKPENIFISAHKNFKVGDFGVARELGKTSGSLSQKGTYNYMAPEITTSTRYDATVDIYSLGLVLYKLLNNDRLPFLDPKAQLIQYQDRKNAIDRRLSGEALPAPINANPQLAQVILTACAFHPAARFQSPTAFKNALGAVLGAAPIPGPPDDMDKTTSVRRAPPAPPAPPQPPPPPSPPPPPPPSGGGRKVGVIALVILVILAIGAYGIWYNDPFGFFDSSEHTVVFYLNDGTSTVFGAPVTVEEGDTVALPFYTPHRAGYTFLYWTRDRAGNYRYNFDTRVTEDTSLYAQWGEVVPVYDGPAIVDETYDEMLAPEYTDTPPELSHFVAFDMGAIDGIISQRASPSDVAVSILDLNTMEMHVTANGNTPFVASGFYAPLYNIVLSHSSARQTADTMMATMDNAAANALIEGIGGFAQVNGILSNLGFAETRFGRNFGDVEASRRGHENYTTAREAAWILGELYENGGYLKMSFDLTRDGVILPGGIVVYAHRGAGIGAAYNVFAVIVTPSVNYVVVVLTSGLGSDSAAPIVSELLANIQQQMEQIHG
ncbi:MAG: protein kinase [Oscillospiraceae bacterium]|nr:protein kinase [Oscillospiraceae bacterium]